MDVNEAFVSCADKWASEEFDDRIDGAIDTFEEWISKFDEREKELLAKMLLKFDYYSKGGISKIIRSLCTESVKKYGISNANSIISVVRKKDGKHNSSYDYWMLHRWVSGLSNEIYYDSVDDINEEYWGNIRKVVYIDDCSGTGKQFVTFMKRQRKSYLDKEVILLVIEAVEEAKLYIKSELEKEGINIKIMAYTTKEKALKSLLEEEKKMFLDMSQKRGISSKYILGFEEAEALMAFYNNTPNDTLGLFWFTSKENNPIFPRKLEEKPQWKFDREEKIKRRRQQYEAKC